VVTGTVQIPVNIEDEKICSTFVDRNDNDKEEMNMKDIYKQLKLRGYQYTGEFHGLRSASITGKNGHIAWTDNWVTFMDNMLQIMILGQNLRSLFVPTRIRKVIIDPKSHMKHIEKLSNEEARKFTILQMDTIFNRILFFEKYILDMLLSLYPQKSLYKIINT